MKSLLLCITMCTGVSVFAQTNTESLIGGLNNPTERISAPAPGASEMTPAPKKTLRLDLTIYRDEENVKVSSGETRSSMNTFEIQPRYYLTQQMYLTATFQQVEGRVDRNPAAGSDSRLDVSGFMEPTLEWAYITTGDVRYYGGALYRFDTGAAKSKDDVVSPKKGGQAIEPLLGIEADLPGHLAGIEYRYTIEGTRHEESESGRNTLTEGNRNLLYGFIEQTTKYGPGVGLAYFQKDRTAVKDADKNPGYTKVYGEVYLQIPMPENVTLIPLVSYSKNLETRVRGEDVSRNENYNLTVTGRARF